MQGIFLKIVSIGINASWMILAVLVLRMLFRKSPKWMICLLWVLVGVKLTCPWNIESAMSLVPIQLEATSGYVEKNVNQGVQERAHVHINRNPIVKRSGKENGTVSSLDKKEPVALNDKATTIAMSIWLGVVIVMLLYFFKRCISIYKRTETATHFKENIWESEYATSPFVFGLFRPRIYIPYGMNQENLDFVLAHERTHIRRKDHIVKLAAFFILAVYWFQPLVWIAYISLGRDMELACDEKAAASLDTQGRKKYLLTLLDCTVSSRGESIYPLAFGKVGIKERVICMKKWKKPSFALMIVTLFAVVLVSVGFLTNPKKQETVNAQEAVKKASVDLHESTGADGTMLYYVDDNKIIFGGTYGLFVHDKKSGKITESLNLKEINCEHTQGDAYCDIAADKEGQNVYLHPKSQKKLYTWNLASNKLEVKEYTGSDMWKDNSLNLLRVDNAKQISYRNSNNEEMICKLDENDFTIGKCEYAEYTKNGSKKKEQGLLFQGN